MTRIATLAAIAAMGVSLPPLAAIQTKQAKRQPYGVQCKGRIGSHTPPMVKTKKQKRKHTRPASQRRRKK